tara:strand:+ start:1464 stop:2387 length:924 start_codon:yes stop_codon:yes gene_type:complete
MRNILNYFLIFFFLFNSSKSFGNINNSIIISVGNLPITRLDLIKEMTLISILTKSRIDSSNKERIKAIAVQALVKRKIKEIEIERLGIKNYNKKDLEMMVLNTSKNLGINKDGLKEMIESNNLNFEKFKERFKIDLMWNTLIFQLYRNKVVLNTSEVENKITKEIQKSQPQRIFLLSEIEINQTDNNDFTLNKILEEIKNISFESAAKKFSISKSAEYGGNIGWINQKDLSKKIYNNIIDLKTDEIGKPIFLDNTILLIKKTGEKVIEKDIQKIKDRILSQEKEKKLQMFSKAHFSSLEKRIQVNFL